MACRFYGYLLVLLGLFLSVSRGMHAAEMKPTVAIVYSGEKTLALRLKAEIALLGFAPEPVERPAPISLRDLKNIAKDRAAAAVVRISENNESIGVWIPQSDAGIVVMQEVYVPGPSDQDHAIVAFKAGELLRAGMLLQEEGDGKRPSTTSSSKASRRDDDAVLEREGAESSRGAAATSERSNAASGRAFNRLSLGIAPAVSYGFGELPPAFQIGAALQLQVTSKLFLTLLGIVPSFPMRETVSEGKIDATTGFVALGIGLRLTPIDWRVSVPIEAFAGTAFVRIFGIANSEAYQSMEARVLVAIVGGRTGFSAALSDTVSLRGDVIVGTAVPRPVAEILDETWTGWGRPLLIGMLGVDVWLF